MELSFVREFVLLAEIRKFSAAAEYLHISQSTLSRHIQSLENELGQPLLIRTTRSLELSQYGALFLPHARVICLEYEKALSDFVAAEQSKNGTIHLGIVHNPDRYHIIECILGFQQEYPDIPIQITEGSLSELYAMFYDETLSMITAMYAGWESIPSHFIAAGRSRLVAVLPDSHPLAGLDIIPLSSLAHERLIVPEKLNYSYRYLEHAFQEQKITPSIFYQGNSSGISALLQADHGILIQDYALASGQLTGHLVCRDLEPAISYSYGLKYRQTPTRNERTFAHYVSLFFENAKSRE